MPFSHHSDPNIDAGDFSPWEYVQVRGPVGWVAPAKPDLNGVRQEANVLCVGNPNAPIAQEHQTFSIHLRVLAHLVSAPTPLRRSTQGV